MEALVLDAEKRTAQIRRIPRPIPSEGEVLVRVHYVALNPVDSLYVFEPLGATGRVVGSDWSGTVVESDRDDFPPGTRVAGFLQGACSINDRPGAFSEYLVCPWDLLWRVGETESLEAASSVPLCALTAAQALFCRLGLEASFSWTKSANTIPKTPGTDSHGPVFFLIYGASTSVGMYAAQLLRQATAANGRTLVLIGTGSKSRFPMLQASPYSYDALVEYRDTDWPEQIRKHTGGRGVDFAFDCVAEGDTVRLTSQVLVPDGRMAIVRSEEGNAFNKTGVVGRPSYGAVWEAFGVEVQYLGMTLPASADARAFAVAFYKWLSETQAIQPNPIRLMPGGLQSIVRDGFTLLGGGTMGDRAQDRTEAWMQPISAEKLVYTVADAIPSHD